MVGSDRAAVMFGIARVEMRGAMNLVPLPAGAHPPDAHYAAASQRVPFRSCVRCPD